MLSDQGIPVPSDEPIKPVGIVEVHLMPSGAVQLSIQQVPNGWPTVFAMLGQAVAIAGAQREAMLGQEPSRIQLVGADALRRMN